MKIQVIITTPYPHEKPGTGGALVLIDDRRMTLAEWVLSVETRVAELEKRT